MLRSRWNKAMAAQFAWGTVLGLTACSGGSDPQALGRLGEGSESAGKGCVQGVVVDGVSGTKVNLIEKKAQIFVLVNAQRIKASLVKGDELSGEYYICGVPLDETYAFYALVDGYEDFYSSVGISSSVAARTTAAGSQDDIVKAVPTQLANVRIFPTGTAPQDLVFSVTSNGAPVSGATVLVKSTGGFRISDSGFLSPADTRLEAVSVATNEAGQATFAKDQLTFGMAYEYTVYPPNGGAQQSFKTGSFYLGVEDTSADPYRVFVDLEYAPAPLAVASTSLASTDTSASGQIRIVFNRDIEIAPGTADGIRAQLSGQGRDSTADLVDDVTGNNASESATVTVSGNTLTLVPAFAPGSSPSASTDPALRVTYTGVKIKGTTSPESETIVDLTTALSTPVSVSFFGAASNSQPVSVRATSDMYFDITDTAGSKTLAVEVKDAEGNLLSGVPVRWRVSSSGGFITSASATSGTTNTGTNGVAAATWTKSTYGGYHTATAQVDNLPPITFYWDVSGPKTVSITSTQTEGAKNAAMAAPVIVKILDQDDSAVVGENVIFYLGQNFGTAAEVGNAGNNGDLITVATDTNGEAQVTWTLGDFVGEQVIRARVDGFGELTFTVNATN